MKLEFVCIGLLGLLAVALTANVVRLRRKKRISLGDGGDKEMLSAIRAHANFMEVVPFGLILILTVMNLYGDARSGILAALLLLCRLLHAGGMLGFIGRGRFLGAAGTAVVFVAASLMVLLGALGAKPF